MTGTWVPGGGGGSMLNPDNDAVGGIYKGCGIMIWPMGCNWRIPSD